MGLKDLFSAHAAQDEAKEEEHAINVTGMHCGACEKRVVMALEELGATDASANHETGLVTYRGTLEAAAVEQAIADLGFRVA